MLASATPMPNRAGQPMQRSLPSLILALLALLMVPWPAEAQQRERSPNELWEAFPLDPAPTRSTSTTTPEATPSAGASPAPETKPSGEDDGIPVLVLMLIAGAFLGALSMYTALRRTARRRRVTLPVQLRTSDPPPDPALRIKSGKAIGTGDPEALRAPRKTKRAQDNGLQPGEPAEDRKARLGVRRLVGLVASVLALAAVEVVIARGHVLAGQVADAVLVFLLVKAGRRHGEREPVDEPDLIAAAMRALALVALIRVVGIGLPLREVPEALRDSVLAIVIGIAALRAAPAVGVNLRTLLATPSRRNQWGTSFGGLALGLGAYLLGAPSLSTGDAGGPLLLAAVAVTGAAVVEEIIFRGLVQVSLQRLMGGLGAVATSGLFACSYISFGSVSLVLLIALAGLLFAHSVAVSGVLGGALAGHALFAVGAGVVWPTLLGPAPSQVLPEPVTQLTLSAAVIIGAVLLARRSLWPVARPAAKNGPLPSLEHTLVSESQRI